MTPPAVRAVAEALLPLVSMAQTSLESDQEIANALADTACAALATDPDVRAALLGVVLEPRDATACEKTAALDALNAILAALRPPEAN